MRVILHSEAEAELEDAFHWYESKAGGLGRELLDEVDEGIERIRETLDTWPLYAEDLGVRRFLLHRFPFAILYRAGSDMIQIVAIMHLRRKPGYWAHRLRR
jgi:toxin ParE1/3/4